MSIPGPQALASLDEAMRDIRREEEEISRRLARSAEKLGKMRENEAELFRQLAQLRLDPAVQSELDGTISSAETRARDMFKAHARDLSRSEAEIAEADAALARLTAERSEALAHYGRQQAELQALAARLGPVLTADPALSEQKRKAAELAEIAEQSMRKTEQAETDRDQKGKPYRDDPLFSYLWDNGYGTSAYKGSNLVRYFDGLVANLVGFGKARPNFAMLNELPLRLREHAERQIENARLAEAELDQLETTAIDNAGGKPLRDAIAAAQARIDALDDGITQAEDRRDAVARTLGEMSQGGNPAFEGALAELAKALGREDLQTLLAEARLTRTGQDDTIVAQIDDARARAKDEEGEAREQTERLKTLTARRRELEDIQWEFKKQRFDDPRSSFRDEKLVSDVLNDFLRGGISAASYWDHWRRSQNWSNGSTDWGGGLGLPNNGRSSGNSPWRQGGGSTFNWPDSSFGGGSKPRGRPGGGGFGGGWGSGMGGGFSRPRSGSINPPKGGGGGGGFKTGGGF